MEDRVMKPTKRCLKRGGGEEWEYNGGVNLIKMHAHMYRISTIKPLMLMYANSKLKK
jgi:hypothetical protein